MTSITSMDFNITIITRAKGANGIKGITDTISHYAITSRTTTSSSKYCIAGRSGLRTLAGVTRSTTSHSYPPPVRLTRPIAIQTGGVSSYPDLPAWL